MVLQYSFKQKINKMKKLQIIFISGIILVLISTDIYSQAVKIYGVFRPRMEYLHGYKTLFPEGARPAMFISQRSRLGLKFSNDRFNVGFSIQNVGVWGETGTLSKSDIYGTAVHEAWGEVLFSDKFSVKAGRQEINYDDQRIFGAVDWTQQARSHDALLLKIKPNENNKIDIGFAYNALGESLYRMNYMTNNYKTFQYAHWHGQFNSFGISVLALNNGMPYISDDTTSTGNYMEKVAYSQTIGPRLSFKKNNIKANLGFYYQVGKKTVIRQSPYDTTMNIRALYFNIDFYYTIAKMFTVGAGLEYLSGNDEKAIADNKGVQETENAFAPFYGTNHKFNGWMDYFYVGNHFGSVGLMDIYIPLKFKKDKFTAMVIPHFFSTAATMYRQEMDDKWQPVYNDDGTPKMIEPSKGLGTEVDMVASYSVAKSVTVKAGYSMMFASESMEYLKNTQKDKGNTWGWLMLVFKPTFYQSK
jgi:hypothetical protein